MNQAPSYRRAFSTLGCVEVDLASALALAQRHGLDGIELRGLSGELDLSAVFTREFGTPENFAAALAASSVPVLALDTSWALTKHAEGDTRELLAYVPWAEAAEIPWLRVFDGHAHGSLVENADRFATALKWWEEQRARHGWRTQLMVETHDTLLHTDAILEFCRRAPGAKLLWDAHNMWRRHGEDPVRVWESLRPHVAHIHVKDSVSRPSARHPYTYVPPGEGEFPAAALFAALRTSGYNGAVSLEWERRWHPYLAPLDAALASAQRHAWW